MTLRERIFFLSMILTIGLMSSILEAVEMEVLTQNIAFSQDAHFQDPQANKLSRDCDPPGTITVVESMAHEIIIRCTLADFGGGARMELDGQTLFEANMASGTQTVLFHQLDSRTDYNICVWNFCDEGLTQRSDEQCRTVGTIEEGSCDPPSSWRLNEVTETSFTFDIDVGDFPGVMVIWKNDRLYRIKQLPAGAYNYSVGGGENGDVFDIWMWEYCNAGKTEISPRGVRQVTLGHTQPSSCCEDFAEIERWITHVPASAGIYRGTLLFYSKSQETEDMTLCAFDGSGSLLEQTELSFSPRTTERHATTALFDSPDVSFIRLCGPRSIAGSIIYENVSDPTPCVVPEDVSCGRVLRFTAGGANNWDGFAALNTNETIQANLEITQYSVSGSAIVSVDLTVDPASKTVVNLYTQGFSPAENAYFEVRSNISVCLMALRGLLDRSCGDALFTNPVQDIE